MVREQEQIEVGEDVQKLNQRDKGGNKMTKGIPKKDGSGRGMRLNKGRGGCDELEEEGKGQKTFRESNRKRRNIFQ